MSKKQITSRTKSSTNHDNYNSNLSEIKIELQKLKIEYEKELQIYKESSRDIIDSEEKFNNLSKKINKIAYKQMTLANKIDNEYITNLNNYKIEQNIKIIFLSLLGFPFPNQEPFYFDSPDNLIAQLFLSKEFLFDLLITKKNEYDMIKSKYDNLDKDINILKPLYEYMKLNFEIVNLLQKRENIFEQNKKYIKDKDNSLINVKNLKKKIKEKFSLMKKILKPNQNQNQNNKNSKNNNLTQKSKDFDEITNTSHLLSIKDFDEISGKSFILSLSNDNSILDLFSEDEINKLETVTKKLNHKNYNKNSNTYNVTEESNDDIYISGIKSGRNLKRFSRSPDANSNMLTEEKKNINKLSNKSEILVEKYRSPQHKSKGKDTLEIETPIGDSGCCASCT